MALNDLSFANRVCFLGRRQLGQAFWGQGIVMATASTMMMLLSFQAYNSFFYRTSRQLLCEQTSECSKELHQIKIFHNEKCQRGKQNEN